MHAERTIAVMESGRTSLFHQRESPGANGVRAGHCGGGHGGGVVGGGEAIVGCRNYSEHRKIKGG